MDRSFLLHLGYGMLGEALQEVCERLEQRCYKHAMMNLFEISFAVDNLNVARLRDVYHNTPRLAMVTECMSGGDVSNTIKVY